MAVRRRGDEAVPVRAGDLPTTPPSGGAAGRGAMWTHELKAAVVVITVVQVGRHRQDALLLRPVGLHVGPEREIILTHNTVLNWSSVERDSQRLMLVHT